MTDEKEKVTASEEEKTSVTKEEKTSVPDDNWVSDMKADMEEYIEEQGIYIRQ